jgi:hypothetical protein
MYTKEPVLLSDKRFDTIANMIYKSYEKSCICWIEEICNDELLSRYINRKEQLINEYGDSLQELALFHGTKSDCIHSIASDGFKSELNVTSAYGKGTYFAANAKLSSGYMRATSEITYMFLCDVLVGKKVCDRVSTIANGVARVDNIKNSNIYVIPDNDACYPRYIIAFYKNAQF